MGFRFRKSIKVGPARINLSKSGVGYSVGTKGLRVTKKAGGGTRTTASIPGTGISYSSDSKKRKTSSSKKRSSPQTSSAQKNSGCLPAAGVLILLAVVVNFVKEHPVGSISILLLIVGVILFFIFRNRAKRDKLPEGDNSDLNTVEEQSAPKPESEVRTYRVAGVEHYLDNLLSMMQPNYLYTYKKQELIDACCVNENVYKETIPTDQLELVPEPTNPHDPNAIMVHLGGKLVGYIPATDCEHVLEVINNDRILSLTCQVEGGKYKMVDEDYDCIKDKSTYKMETGEDPYGITIYIREKL